MEDGERKDGSTHTHIHTHTQTSPHTHTQVTITGIRRRGMMKQSATHLLRQFRALQSLHTCSSDGRCGCQSQNHATANRQGLWRPHTRTHTYTHKTGVSASRLVATHGRQGATYALQADDPPSCYTQSGHQATVILCHDVWAGKSWCHSAVRGTGVQ